MVRIILQREKSRRNESLIHYMETIYLGIVIFLFMLAIFDLMVGVSNDAVNFMSSAIGAKVAGFKTIIIISAIGVFAGAAMSNGMMDIARHGIFQPDNYAFYDIMCILLAVMVTDVVLLDVFNTLGLPTSTTVSMVFELLGGTFVIATIKLLGDETGLLNYGNLLNTEKALSVIMGIFCSIAIAFVAGSIVQYLSRLLFSFNYKKNMKWTIGIFGGIACTALCYFIVIKGLKGSTIVTKETLAWVNANTGLLVLYFFIGFGVLMQILHFLKVNVFKIIILLGTFSLALAFAGNDLVNFIGVPLAGYSAFTDWAANGQELGIHGFMMESLMGSAKTPEIFLIGAGVIMVYSLATSKKARNVIKTSVDLSRQDEGDEMFGSSLLARIIVRKATSLNAFIEKTVPVGVRRWVDSRFQRDEMVMDEGAAFDLVRASVNLVLAGLLIVIGTSLKLPLSTTYVTFIVAMGTSLADRAWGRESAVYRITGMLSVIGGWFITAFAAFIACGVVVITMYYLSFPAMIVFIVLAVFLLVRSNLRYAKKAKEQKPDDVFGMMLAANAKGDEKATLALLRRHVRETLGQYLGFADEAYAQATTGFSSEDLRKLRKATRGADESIKMLKKRRRKELIGLRMLPKEVAVEKNTWFHLGCNSCEQMLYCIKRIGDPCKEHVDNNFYPVQQEWSEELQPIQNHISELLLRTKTVVDTGNYTDADAILLDGENYKSTISQLRKKQMNRMQGLSSQEVRVSMVYLNILQESQELISAMRHLLRASRFFQSDAHQSAESEIQSLAEQI